MKKLIVVLTALVSSCGISNEEYAEITYLNNLNYSIAQEKSWHFRNIIDRIRVESIIIKEYTSELKQLETDCYDFINAIDTAISNDNYDDINNILVQYHDILVSFDSLTIESKEVWNNRTISSSVDSMKLYKNKIHVYERIKGDVMLTWANYLEFKLEMIDGPCSFKKIENPDSKSVIDPHGNTTILLSSEHIQRFDAGKVITVDEIYYNNKNVDIPVNISNNYSFASIKLDSLLNGDYTLKGKVEYNSVKNGKQEFPFTHHFKVNLPK